MKKPEHLALPLKVYVDPYDIRDLYDANGEQIRTEEELKYIAHCVNNHEALMEALAKIAAPTGMGPHRPSEVNLQIIARDALKLARGEK